jgi:peptide-methionine (S)-S-oxide reductase
MIRKLKKRWNIDTNFQAILILVVFSLTGMATLWVRKAVWPLLGLDADTALWVKALLYVLIIFPAYQILLLLIALILGQFRFFWAFEQKMLHRVGIRSRKNTLIIVVLLFTSVNTYSMDSNKETATLGGGCFWCTEAVYLNLRGVEKVTPGYSGGHIKNPAYREVTTGRTGHAEVVQIVYDPAVVKFSEILEVFFMTHDPTTLNRQGADVGTQYRSAIFYHNEKQKEIAEVIISQLEKQKVFEDPIVTEVTAFTNFFEAEDYHLNYYARNKNQPYCQFVIAPKLKKFEKIFREKLKD